MKRIAYRIANRYNIGTEEEPIWNESIFGKDIPYSEENLEMARTESYNGEEPNVYDDGKPEPEEQPSEAERIAELEEALEMLLNGVTE